MAPTLHAYPNQCRYHASLGGMIPIMTIPIIFVMKKEKIGARRIIGSIISIAGADVILID